MTDTVSAGTEPEVNKLRQASARRDPTSLDALVRDFVSVRTLRVVSSVVCGADVRQTEVLYLECRPWRDGENPLPGEWSHGSCSLRTWRRWSKTATLHVGTFPGLPEHCGRVAADYHADEV